MQSAHLDWALAYARKGWKVFPLTARDKVPPKGFEWVAEASSDPATIRDWWSEFPNDNIGLACGAGSNVFVVDLDSTDAVAAFDALCRDHGGLPEQPLVVRTSKGLHLYFQHADGLRNTVKRLPGIDTRGEGGYVVAPPSIHPSGAQYELLRDAPLPVPPSWLIDVFGARAIVKRERAEGEPELSTRVHTLVREDLELYALSQSRRASRPSTSQSEQAAATKLATAARNILDGTSWAPKGERDSVMHAFVGSLGVWVAEKYDADIDARPEALGIFEPSLVAVRAEGVGRATDVEWLAGKFAISGARQFHADLKAERDAEAGVAEIEEFFANRDAVTRGGPDHWKHTDLGNAERLTARHGDCFRYVTPWGLWYVWDGRRWVKDEKEIRLGAAAKETVRNIYKSADEEPDEDRAKSLRKFAFGSESRSSLGNMVALARSARPPTAHTELDTDPWLLNVENGTIDLRTGVLRPHNQADLLTKLAPVRYDQAQVLNAGGQVRDDLDAAPAYVDSVEGGGCPRWLQFVLEVCDGHTELASYLQRAVGYSLTGKVSEHALFLCHGMGSNGKSVFVGTVLKLLGEYGGKAPMDLLMRTNANKHETGIAKLHGLRLAAVTETEEGSAWAESVVKDLTGGDQITARRMREDFWDFAPTHKLWVCANHEPEVRGTDEGIRRRMRKVPFNVSFKGREDKNLAEELESELPGILAWAVRGCLAWQQDGLCEPADVTQATAEYLQENDLVGRFVSERCTVAPEARVPRADLYQAFENWCATQGERFPPKQKTFARRLRVFGAVDSKVRTSQGPRDAWAGISLLGATGDPAMTN